MVRIHPDPPLSCLGVLTDQLCMTGGLAQLGEHLLCKQGVVGSIPSSSTITLDIDRWRKPCPSGRLSPAIRKNRLSFFNNS